MDKTKKTKAITLVIIYAISIILIIVGIVMNNGNKNNSNRYTRLSLYNPYSTYTDTYDQEFIFEAKSSGYYYIYLDGTSLSDVVSTNGEYLSAYTYSSNYYNGYYYDYSYRVYISSEYNDYVLRTNCSKGEYIKICVSNY